ncbi:HIT domain-containing protein [Alteromonas sp. ASW11-19]|uniref:HIT domain-containing protein n=1 Tax=Alteromonas salexigens TaxID=2982530 RepID=A0ABT2VLA9_9ALTE|nr:HIT domain-containing protein [Alteromonas salexigens]MCU7553860.1 HIT domain-containing protein [Alteromonas salexigens]
MFELDSRLQQDTLQVGALPLSRVLLMNDSQFPWVILVPQRSGVREIIELNKDDEAQLWRESRQVSEALQKLYSPHKLNVAALGNVVSQLHVHHVARYTHDCAWPAPVWGKQAAVPYSDKEGRSRCEALAEQLNIVTSK